MTSVLKEDDKIFTMYIQYKELIYKNAEKGENRVYGTDQLAAQLTVAHMLDHVVCLLKKDEPPTGRKVNKIWMEKFGTTAVSGDEERESSLPKLSTEEVEIMRNNFTYKRPLQDYSFYLSPEV